jgi:hypothetical protein
VRFTVGQVPVQPLSVTLVSDTGAPVDLTQYNGFDLVLIAPEGQTVDTSAGQTSVVNGKVRYVWPTTTLFAKPGDYSLFVKAKNGSAVDFTETLTIPVSREGGPS